MLGSILDCFEKLVRQKFGKDTWDSILLKSDLQEDYRVFAHRVYDDKIFDKLFAATCEELRLTKEEVSKEFGKAWMKYASEKYFAFFTTQSSARKFILSMDNTHTKITDKVENAHPPQFTYEEINSLTLIMKYHSSRNLNYIWIGLLESIGEHFNEKVEVIRLDDNTAKIIFEKP